MSPRGWPSGDSGLEAHEGYRGPDEMGDILAWLAEHDERVGVDIFPASVDLS